MPRHVRVEGRRGVGEARMNRDCVGIPACWRMDWAERKMFRDVGLSVELIGLAVVLGAAVVQLCLEHFWQERPAQLRAGGPTLLACS